MTKLALIGYGQMGKLIDKLAVSYDCDVIVRVDPKLDTFLSSTILSSVDVCIDFSLPDTVLDNIKIYIENKKNCVIGATGWQDNLTHVEDLVTSSGIGMVYADNFSLGMNLYYKIIDYTTKLMNKIKEYDVFGYELHHNLKVDSPSGTAKKISDIVIANLKNKSEAQFDRLNRKIKPGEFHFASIRGGKIPGTHHLGFDSQADTIELSHIARNRDGFAIGALLAAKMIKNRQGFYNFGDIFDEIFR